MIRPKMALFLVLTPFLATPVFAQSGSAPSAVLQAPQSIAFGAPLTLSGAQSFDTDGTIIRYVWTKITGAGGGMALNQSFGTLEATYVVPQPAGHPLAVGRHRFRLVVDDNSGNHSTPTEAEVIVVDNIPPTALLDAPQSIAIGSALQLSGARSTDVGGQVTQYIWTHMEGGGSNLPLNQPLVTDTNSIVVPQAANNPLAIGRHRFRLVVTDDAGNQSKAVEAPVIVVDNIPPTAVLEGPKQAMQIQPFQLSGARSSDVGDRVRQFQWTRISGTPDGPMPLGQPVVTDASTFTVAQTLASYFGVGRHVLRLVVVDDSGNQSNPADFPVEITAPLPSGRTK
ncbi:MAG: hypothetical protein AB7T20_13880 [Steroidobacteraceae bacterium]